MKLNGFPFVVSALAPFFLVSCSGSGDGAGNDGARVGGGGDGGMSNTETQPGGTDAPPTASVTATAPPRASTDGPTPATNAPNAPLGTAPSTGTPNAGGQSSAGTGGTAGSGGSPGTGAQGGFVAAGGEVSMGVGGTVAAVGGASGVGGGSAGSGVGGGFVGGEPDVPMLEPLDCGENGTALEEHGPAANRLNYVIVGDGYSEEELAPGGALDQHLEAMLAKRFSEPIGRPYLRYRKFVNICVLRIPSGPICGQSEFGCCGDDGSRLANCDNGAVNSAIGENLPESFEVDWRSVVLNGSSWWNSGGTLMMWSGGNPDAAGAALHEGGHGHNFISDEYGECERGRVSNEATYGANISLSEGDSGGKWDDWIGYDQSPGTGEQGFFACDGNGTWRPSQNSMMNSLFGDDPDTSYNPVSREKIVMDIWRVVERPYDSLSPEEGPVTNPSTLTVGVIDPEVISVDWTLDGELIALDGGPSYDITAAALAAGTYTVTARAYDNADTDLVRQVPGSTFNRQYWGSGEMGHSDKTVTWTVTIQ